MLTIILISTCIGLLWYYTTKKGDEGIIATIISFFLLLGICGLYHAIIQASYYEGAHAPTYIRTDVEPFKVKHIPLIEKIADSRTVIKDIVNDPVLRELYQPMLDSMNDRGMCLQNYIEYEYKGMFDGYPASWVHKTFIKAVLRHLYNQRIIQQGTKVALEKE